MSEPHEIIICRPHYAEIKLSRSHCFCSEKRSRWMLCLFDPWRGWRQTCLRCGEQYGDGEQLQRPFKPRWRQENIQRAERFYRENGPRKMTEDDRK